ncbi:hypothetical protein DM02DRAFT_656210 [Periconia macrospinosa]|uniref:Uncharacterized protein n=1 Tax=Periconia macrospinosa TaxID=97972 RepID=A0A2V1DMZ6_9PLEO|nr:hypothetical protein DM02DRAFT_656210 [Periconia macrospinosa]
MQQGSCETVRLVAYMALTFMYYPIGIIDKGGNRHDQSTSSTQFINYPIKSDRDPYET